jgi:hypothetical protein
LKCDDVEGDAAPLGVDRQVEGEAHLKGVEVKLLLLK